MDDYFIRPIEPKDLERALGIISRHDENDEDVAREFFRLYFEQDEIDPLNGQHYVLEWEGDLVAIGGYISTSQSASYWVGFLFVDPYFRGHKLGTALLHRVIKDIQSMGASELRVGISPDAISSNAVKFYQINGFERSDLNDPPPHPYYEHTVVYRRLL